MLITATARKIAPSAVSASRRGAVAICSIRSKHTLPDLPYGYEALEPSISKEIMTLHHSKHHQAYITGLNAAESSLASIQSQLDSDPSPSAVKELVALQPALKFNGGGHINHSLFWKNLAPTGSVETKFESVKDGAFGKLVTEQWGGLDGLKKDMNAKTAGVQGSGWGWLGYNKATKKLDIVTTANQDPLLSHVPIIGIDIWEHAFYLQYKNVKPDYLNAIWDVINFQEAEKRLQAAM